MDAAANAAVGLGKGIFSMGMGLVSMGAKVVSESVLAASQTDPGKDTPPPQTEEPKLFPAFFTPVETVQDDTAPNARRPEAIGWGAAKRRTLELPMFFFGDRKVDDTADIMRRRTEPIANMGFITNMGFTRSHAFKTPALFSTKVEETTETPDFVFFGFTKADIKLPTFSFLSF